MDLKKRMPFVFFAAFAVGFVWFMLSFTPADDDGEIQYLASRFFSLFRSSDREEAEVHLKAIPYRQGGRFQIQNDDTFAWTNVRLKITYIGENGEKWDWEEEVDRADPGHTYFGELVKVSDDGTKVYPWYEGRRAHFRPKKIEVRVWADTPKGKGFYVYHY